MTCHVEERKKVDWVYRNYDINVFIVEQTSQRVNKMPCTEINRQIGPIGVTKTGNRDEKTGPKLHGRFDLTKIAPRMARLGIFLGTFSSKMHQNAHFCAPGKTLHGGMMLFWHG